MTRAMRERARARIDMQLASCAGPRLQRELTAFTRYCVFRIERDFGELDHWVVEIAPRERGFLTTVLVRDLGRSVQASGRGNDGTLATWDAMCKLEQLLREMRASG